MPRSEIELTAEELQAKYDALAPNNQWGEHPTCAVSAWQSEVAEYNTRLGYWDWVVAQLEQFENDPEDEDE